MYLQPIESSTQDESVPVEIVQEDKDESVSDEGGEIATSLSTDEERIEIDSEDSPHYENIPVQIVQDEDIARRREEESISPFEINEFKKWLGRENLMKGKTILRYVAAFKVIVKDEQA